MCEPEGTADHRARWVAMWREAVRASRRAVGLVELSTTRFIELSDRAAELLGTTPEAGAGLDYLQVAEHPQEAALTFRQAQEGMIDGIRARRRFHQPDGSLVEVESYGWVIRSAAGPDLGLWVANELGSQADRAALDERFVAATPAPATAFDLDALTLDDRWRVAHVSTDAGLLLGRSPIELIGSSVIELTHPDDLAVLLLTFARATSDTNAGVRVRLRHHDGSWRTIEAVVTMLDGDGTSPFAFSWRTISTVVGAARLPQLPALSMRQREVLSRLLRGERVPTIATALFVSQSTVRNHLSAIFKRFGVHSQPELLELMRSLDESSG